MHRIIFNKPVFKAFSLLSAASALSLISHAHSLDEFKKGHGRDNSGKIAEKKHLEIDHDSMHLGSPKDLDPSKPLQICIAGKPAFEDIIGEKLGKSSFNHLALAILGLEDDKTMVIGRQSPSYRYAIDEKTPKKDVGISTEIDNEAFYRLASHKPFVAKNRDELPAIFKEELLKGITYAESEVCLQQPCLMLTSNCGTGLYALVGGIILAVEEREKSPEREETLRRLKGLLADVSEENFGLGLANNSIVQKIYRQFFEAEQAPKRALE